MFYQNSDLVGIEVTSAAFETTISWFPIVLAGATFLFAFSTMISWGYYGEQCWVYLFGEKQFLTYRLLFVLCIFIGSIREDLNTIINFSDMTFFIIAFPNLLGCFLLSGTVAADLKNYLKRLKKSQQSTVNSQQ